MDTATLLKNIVSTDRAAAPHFAPIAPQPGLRVTQGAAAPVSPHLDFATVAAAYRASEDFWLAKLVAQLPEHEKRLGGSWRLGWSDAVPLLWLPPEQTAEELAERERRGLEF